MKPFDLKEYLANPSRKVITRDGREVRIICTDAKGIHPVIALLTSKVGYEEEEETCHSYTYKGRLSVFESSLDLFFEPEKKEGWVNIYKNNFGHIIGSIMIYSSEKEAKDAKEVIWGDNNYTATVKIEWEE